MEPQGSGDILETLAYELPILVTCELLGVPHEDYPKLARWVPDIIGGLDVEVLGSPAKLIKADAAALALDAYFCDLIERRRADPGDDLLSSLIVAADDDDRLSLDELVAFAILLFAAGHETTANLIGNSLVNLFERRDQLDRWINEPEIRRNGVDELLRFDSPVQMAQRVAMKPFDFGGTTVPSGRMMILLFGAANRDPAAFDRSSSVASKHFRWRGIDHRPRGGTDHNVPMPTPSWPLFDLIIRTPRLTLSIVRESDALELIELSDHGIHDPEAMPFLIPWTDEPTPDRWWNSFRFYMKNASGCTPESWNLSFAIRHEGALIGNQDAGADRFPAMRTAGTGSWLGRAFQGQGFGYEARIAVLTLLFDGLGAAEATTGAYFDNLASLRVTEKVGYTPNGEQRVLRRGAVVRGVEFRMTAERWADVRPALSVTIEGIDPVRAFLGLKETPPDRVT